MALNKIYAKFGKEYDGEVVTPTGNILIGSGEGKILPYDMIFGALGSCMFYYFHKFAKQRKIQFDSVTVEVTGTKRETPPTMLNRVNVKYIVKNGEKEKGLISRQDYQQNTVLYFKRFPGLQKCPMKSSLYDS
ncbi:MAG: OsmC family protein [Spirochaetaceae bacterium]|nr:OsmC family protein [Spirochaetaceae bacterium]